MADDTRFRLKTQIYDQFALMGKAFGNARRLEIIDLLAQTEHSVRALAQKTGLSIASVSQHLQVLHDAKIVDVTREGTYAYYRLSDPRVFEIRDLLLGLAHDRNPEINHLLDSHVEERHMLQQIDADELFFRLQQEQSKLTIIDARPYDEYEAGHIPAALSIPLEERQAFLNNLTPEDDVVVYCRASHCLLSDDLALFLKHQGCHVRVFQDGFPKWQAKGYPVERGATIEH